MIKLGVVIGRFQLFDKNHQKLIEYARGKSDEVLVILGSSVKPRSPLNPFTIEDREAVISQAIGSNDLHFDYSIDYLYNRNRWLADIQASILAHTDLVSDEYEVTIYGNRNVVAEDYLEKFPQWKLEIVDTGNYPMFGPLGFTSSALESLFLGTTDWTKNLPEATVKHTAMWLCSDAGQRIADEFDYIKNYRRNTQTGRYETIFQTVDTVAIYKGNVLLIQRRAQPGKGLWALPGGFLNPRELLFDGAVRELNEETSFKINPAWLVNSHTFDHPYRSLRGRTITKAFNFEIPDYKDVPVVVAGDDAAKAQWFPIAEVIDGMVGSLFEDHWDIISYFVE